MTHYTRTKAFNDLGKIDKMHEAGKITKSQHDRMSKNVLKRLTRSMK